MQVKPRDLPARLRRGLAPIYLLTGDEPLLVEEACDAVLHAARDAGFEERTLHYADAGFDWNAVAQDSASLSLFASRRVIDVRVAGDKLDRDAGGVVSRIAADPAPDTLLLIRMSRLDSRQRNSAWYKAIDAAGVVVTVWPVGISEMPRWLAARVQGAGLMLDDDALVLLTERVEGNLLAAVQEIAALKLADLATPISAADLASVLEDSARYGVFELVDAVFAGDGPRVARMLATLRQEGVALFAVLGALTFQIREVAKGGGRLPPARKRLIPALLERLGSPAALERVLAECALVDAQGKGQMPGDAWLSLEDLLLRLAGIRALRGATPAGLLRDTWG